MNYGLPYLGSKSKIATDIISFFPSADNFYDLFAGGCAITHALMVAPRNLFNNGFKNYIVNDINGMPEVFYNAIMGKYHDEKRWISRDDYFKFKDSDNYIRWIWSFGNNGDNYLFSKDIEPIKKAFHYVVMFNNWTYFEGLYTYDFLKETLNKYGIDDSKIFLDLYKSNYRKRLGRKEHLRVIKWIQKNYINVRYNFSELQQLQQLERLERLSLDYREVGIKPNSVIYCDIPYKIKGCNDYLEKEFDHKTFWEWAENQTHPIYVSEYSYSGNHPEKWETVYEKEKISLRQSSDGKRNRNIEKLFWNRKTP
jgi:hypothetical protein